jgi:large repetitive protein
MRKRCVWPRLANAVLLGIGIGIGCGRLGFNVSTDDAILEGASMLCPTAGLIAHWRFDEVVGSTTALDSVGGNDGVLVNMDTASAWQPGAGILGGALAFDGVDDYIALGDPPALQISDAMTISAWVRSDANQHAAILSKEAGNNERGYMLRLVSSTDSTPSGHFAVYGDCSLASQADAAAATLPESWFHLSGVYRPGVSIELYVDGVLGGRVTAGIPASQCNPPVNVNIGRRPNGLFPLNGLLDDLRVYHRALAADEIAAIYAACR